MATRIHLLLAIALGFALTAATPTIAQEHEGGGSGDDVIHGGNIFGDLVHIKRSPETGQPILQKRWIEYPEDIQDWGYCPIPVDAEGDEIPFAPLSCDADPAYLDFLVEVDYFGRLSAGRTRERNIRMHFDEVIEKIKDGQAIDRDAAGRLVIGTECTVVGGGVDPATCTWKTVDSPQENLAMYNRILRYGHIQTDPLEVNVDFHGDPETGIVYHPALAQTDYAKFQGLFLAILPASATTYVPEPLTSDDFGIAASFLGTAADKTGIITPDLLQYMHRILKVTRATDYAAATLNTLPALIRDCGADPDAPLPPLHCAIYEAPTGLPAPADERFVDYGVMQYDRNRWFSGAADVIKPSGVDTWVLAGAVVMKDYLSFKNPGHQAGVNIEGYVNASLDAVRAVEFLHNYEIPADLGWDFATVVPDPTAVTFLGLTANVQAPQPVGATIQFTAAATGGLAPLGYKWWLFDGTYWTVLKPWSTSNVLDWTPTAANPAYEIGVWVRDGDSTLDEADAFGSMVFPISTGASVQSIVPDLLSPQVVGTTIVFTAAAVGGAAPYEFQWWLSDGSAWTVVQPWNASATFSWTPTVANPAYRIGVWVRSAGSTQDTPETPTSYMSLLYPITAATVVPLTVTGITANPATPPQPVGTTIDFTATATGGTAPYEYRWWVFNGVTWTLALEWSSNATFTWTPNTANPAYRVGVWVRSAGSTSNTPETTSSYLSIPYAISALP